ncbi:hypothetical protein PGT21_012091 [Puccinia graminis f. sp. tritici]|uniref:Uncharacterized protein n=1 Tax=Puccinia graminis f. sp. tritici TaxID=56615 RepID=A0A5B0LM79_PUCGR|nr:hypothetical protein PGT21_012091 [Puccinia graminis f. sp. tritici]
MASSTVTSRFLGACGYHRSESVVKGLTTSRAWSKGFQSSRHLKSNFTVDETACLDLTEAQ